jgi:hypothetical protein
MITGALKLQQLHPFDLREGLNCKVRLVGVRVLFFMPANSSSCIP